jgi:hypothetical protein
MRDGWNPAIESRPLFEKEGNKRKRGKKVTDYPWLRDENNRTLPHSQAPYPVFNFPPTLSPVNIAARSRHVTIAAA